MTEIERVEPVFEGRIVIDNPAWDYISAVPADPTGTWNYLRAQAITPFTMDGETFHGHRDYVTSRWTWAIPSPDSIDFIVDALDGRPVVEIGAGNGYWAWLLDQSGVHVNAYDIAPVGHEHSWFNEKRLQERGGKDAPEHPEEFFPVQQGGVEVLDLPENRDRVLFLCWPTMDTWAREAVQRFQGDTIIYIGEGPSGCTADSAFFKAVGEECGCWAWIEEDPHEPDCVATKPIFERLEVGPLYQWGAINDYLTIYRRVQ